MLKCWSIDSVHWLLSYIVSFKDPKTGNHSSRVDQKYRLSFSFSRNSIEPHLTAPSPRIVFSSCLLSYCVFHLHGLIRFNFTGLFHLFLFPACSLSVLLTAQFCSGSGTTNKKHSTKHGNFTSHRRAAWFVMVCSADWLCWAFSDAMMLIQLLRRNI